VKKKMIRKIIFELKGHNAELKGHNAELKGHNA